METETRLFRNIKFRHDMDKNSIRKLCESFIGTTYSGSTICDFDMTPTFKYDESLNEWVPDSFAVFIQIKSPLQRESLRPTNVQETLEGLLGFECCVDFA
jgi:hypothetical protein